ncbi:hypothetical protein DQ04_05191020 [Trypanosoma grayi]|uniref:hypothetical protein n=1 Tax=Trypanosoma grayi TaxID=71804 RepID=UPI0004F49799|nr:hypothetical protein DQ04_05191020 [Trypanosoma grayi]KEG09456.1 hypothetical protein DQ04_05191020 [Trypanosoma grayi]
MSQWYETPSQLPPSSPSSRAIGSANAVSALSPMVLLTAAATGVGDGSQAGQRASLLPTFLTPPPSPLSPLSVGVLGGCRSERNRGDGRAGNTQDGASSVATPSLLFENVVVVSGPSLASVSPSLARGLGAQGNSSNSSCLTGNNPADEFVQQMQLPSSSSPCLLAAPLSVTPLSSSPGTTIRGVAAKEVGCVVLKAGYATNCVICLWSLEDAEPSETAPQWLDAEPASKNNSSSSTSPATESVKLGCGHEFHADCLQRWLLTSRVCPMCRREVAPAAGR